MREEFATCKECCQQKKQENFAWRSDRQKYRNICADCHKQRQRSYSKKNWAENKTKIIEKRMERYHSDVLFRLRYNLSSRTRNALKTSGFNKNSDIKNILGAELERVKLHLESQFQEGMTWENRSEWHIDHIIPLASAQSEEELILLCHYTNLQPLWAFDNLSKGDRQ
jgi:hypothetical protein